MRQSGFAASRAGPSLAQNAAARYSQVNDADMQKFRSVLTCTARAPHSDARLLKNRQEDVKVTLADLADAGVKSPNLAAFATSAQADALMPAPETPLSDVMASCTANPDWLCRLQGQDLIGLPQPLEKATDP